MVDENSDTDQIHGGWTQIGSVQQVRVCLLRSAEKVCFQMLMPFNLISKIMLLGFYRSQMIKFRNFLQNIGLN